jgi:hypothetical protein
LCCHKERGSENEEVRRARMKMGGDSLGAGRQRKRKCIDFWNFPARNALFLSSPPPPPPPTLLMMRKREKGKSEKEGWERKCLFGFHIDIRYRESKIHQVTDVFCWGARLPKREEKTKYV